VSIASDLIRGNTEMIILSQLTGGESYGYEINKKLKRISGGRFELKEATLYGAFRRLEESGCVSFYWGDEQTGARRRYYSITQKGTETYAQMLEDWRTACALIEAMISENKGEDENDG
jgi:Predicted transcriptional regulators